MGLDVGPRKILRNHKHLNALIQMVRAGLLPGQGEGLPLFAKFIEREDKPIFGIPVSAVDKENAIIFLRFLLDNYTE